MSVPSMAQLNGNGFYRVRNFMSKRYVYVTDNRGQLNVQSSTADMKAIQLWMGFEKACSDPASICYIEKIGDRYDIKSQGTGVYEIIETYVSIRKNDDGTYYAYGSKDGVTKYLSDGEKNLNLEQGVMSDAGKGEWRKWHVLPINDSDNYFGIKPSINVNGEHYTSFYTAFPYSFASSGMNAYYICKVDNGYAVMREITGTVPAYTPVFVKVSSDQPSSNRLNIGGEGSAVNENLLKGVFFDNDMKTHYNRTAYDPNTMRMLGTMADGKIGFVTSNIDFIPANHAYLQVPAGTPAELKLISEEDYNALNAKKPESITFDRTQVTLLEGEKTTIVATVLPEDAFNKSVKWVTNNPAIALVDNNGTITAVKEGIVNVTGTTVNGLMANCEVIVKKPVAPESITLDRTQVTLFVGDKTTLVATVLPEEATNKHVTWATNDPAIATMDNGTVTGVKAGIVNVTATTDNGKTASCEVIVKDPEVLATSITLDKNVYEAVEGSEFQLTATILPEDVSTKTVTWSSSNTEVATVNDGLVKVLKEGTANITASTSDGTNLSAVCVVNGLSGIEDVFADGAKFPVRIYSAAGVYVKTAYGVNDFKSLAPGLYIAGDKKIVIAER